MFLGALFAALATTGCDESIFDVKNPGRILDDDLNTAAGVKSLVTGMSADFSVGYDNLSFTTAILTDEIVGSGSIFPRVATAGALRFRGRQRVLGVRPAGTLGG